MDDTVFRFMFRSALTRRGSLPADGLDCDGAPKPHARPRGSSAITGDVDIADYPSIMPLSPLSHRRLIDEHCASILV